MSCFNVPATVRPHQPTHRIQAQRRARRSATVDRNRAIVRLAAIGFGAEWAAQLIATLHEPLDAQQQAFVDAALAAHHAALAR